MHNSPGLDRLFEPQQWNIGGMAWTIWASTMEVNAGHALHELAAPPVRLWRLMLR
jgi:hypothetical protein